MSDLVERLRKERSVYDAELCDEAAYEIERLESIIRATINSLKDDMPRTSKHIQRKYEGKYDE